MTIVNYPPPPRLKTGVPSEMHVRLRALVSLLGGFNYRYGSEVQLHATLGQVLLEAGIEFVREFHLDNHSRADFWLPLGDETGLVIEVKVDGTLGDAFRQAARYASLEHVRAVLVASTCRWAREGQIASTGPTDDGKKMLAGKPGAVVYLQRQSL